MFPLNLPEYSISFKTFIPTKNECGIYLPFVAFILTADHYVTKLVEPDVLFLLQGVFNTAYYEDKVSCHTPGCMSHYELLTAGPIRHRSMTPVGSHWNVA